MGRDEKTAKATIRFSLGRGTTEDEINYAVDALHSVVSRMEGFVSG
jgi:cysteine sulfinate desulfinase/cysteine desulfurase-like protein